MNAPLKIFMTIFDSICLILLSALVSFWWAPELTQGKKDVALIRATGLLIIFALYFYKTALKQRLYLSKFLFTFYSALAIFSFVGYIFGFFVK